MGGGSRRVTTASSSRAFASAVRLTRRGNTFSARPRRCASPRSVNVIVPSSGAVCEEIDANDQPSRGTQRKPPPCVGLRSKRSSDGAYDRPRGGLSHVLKSSTLRTSSSGVSHTGAAAFEWSQIWVGYGTACCKEPSKRSTRPATAGTDVKAPKGKSSVGVRSHTHVGARTRRPTAR